MATAAHANARTAHGKPDSLSTDIEKASTARPKRRPHKRSGRPFLPLIKGSISLPASRPFVNDSGNGKKSTDGPTWRATTASTHYQSIENHLLPAFGGILLQKLAAEDIQNFIIQQQKAGAEPATISKQLSPLKTALRQAVTLKKISRTPFEGVRLSKQIQAEVEHLNEGEQIAYINALPDTTTGRLLRFILATGLRIGEAIGLRWEDVEAKQFTVRRTIATVSNFDRAEGETRTRQAVQPTKTGAGLRVIPLGPDMRQLLSRQRIAQAEERLKAGERWEDHGYCFASAVGTPLQVRNVRRVHEKVLDLSGVPRVTLHGLRHTFATRWLSLDNDIRGLSEILGHADVATTLRRYVHSDPAHKAAMMERMGALKKLVGVWIGVQAQKWGT